MQPEQGTVLDDVAIPPSSTPSSIWVAVIGLMMLAAGVRAPLMTQPGFPADTAQFAHWAYLAKRDGLASVYQTSPFTKRPVCNYPPVYVYVLRGLAVVHDLVAPAGGALDPNLIRQLYDGERGEAAERAYLIFKFPGVFCDVLLVGLLTYIAGRNVGLRAAWVVGLAYALLPAAIHNSAMWGQVDSILALLLVTALWCALRQRVIAMSVFAFLAFLTKAQAAMLVPIFAFLLIRWAALDLRKWRRAMLAVGLVILAAVLPFVSQFNGMIAAYTNAASFYPYVHLNSFSGWYLLSPVAENHLDAPQLADWYRPDDTNWLLGITPRGWGFGALLSVWVLTVGALIRNRGSHASIRCAIRVLSLAFFVLSTQMHERYLLPAAVLWLFAYERVWHWWLSWLVIAVTVSINQAWVWANPEDGLFGLVISDKLREVRLANQPIGVWLAVGLIVVLLGQCYQMMRMFISAKKTPLAFDGNGVGVDTDGS